jgi:hypothetical protein
MSKRNQQFEAQCSCSGNGCVEGVVLTMGVNKRKHRVAVTVRNRRLGTYETARLNLEQLLQLGKQCYNMAATLSELPEPARRAHRQDTVASKSDGDPCNGCSQRQACSES